MSVRHRPKPRRCHHLEYYLSCCEFDGLIARAAGRCELCGKQGGPLLIDHDHSVGNGSTGVRGLVCERCNAYLGNVDAGRCAPSEQALRFLAQPWYRTLGDGGMHSLPFHFGDTGAVGLWWIRVDDAVWARASRLARGKGDHLVEVVTEFLATYGSQADPQEGTVNPWDVVNLVVRDVTMGKVGPGTDLEAAARAAADLLRALGMTPSIEDGEWSPES